MSQGDEVRLFVEESILLPRQQVGMEEIREIELIPHISVFEEREKVLIDGILLCRGRYQGRERTPFSEQAMLESKQGIFSSSFKAGELFHEIPVQIEIAKERINDIEKVYVKIDSFDYDVVDPHQLLITAELCIEGVRGAQKVEQGETFTPNPDPPFNWEVWEQWNEEKLLRIAAADDPLREETEEKTKPQSGSTPLFRFHESMQWNLPREERLKVEKQEGKRIEQHEEHVNTDLLEEEEVKETLTEQNSEEGSEQISKETSEEINEEFSKKVTSMMEEDAQEKMNPTVEESESLQVANPAHEDDEKGAHLSSFLPEGDETPEKAATHEQEESVSKQTEALGTESNQERESDQAEVESEAEEVHVEAEATAEEVQEQTEEVVKEFKVTIGKRAIDEERNTTEASLEGMDLELELDVVAEATESPEKELRYYLYPDKEDGPSFTKVKLCIVQREETLFEIAQRYEMTPKQLMEFNQLASAELAEGQLLYIPTPI